VAAGTTLLVSGLAFTDAAYRSTSLHISVETAIAVISIVVAHLVFGRFRQRARLDDLVLFYAFAAFAVSNLLLSALPAALGMSYPDGVDTWGPILGILAAASLLLASAHVSARPVDRMFWNRIDRAAAALVVAATAGALVVLIGFGKTPSVAPFAPSQWSWSDLSRHAEVDLQVLVSFLFLAAAFALARRAEKMNDQFLTWLAVGAALAAFARVNYFILPSLYSHWVYLGDGFRLLFYLIVFIGAAREISGYQQRAADIAILEERRRMARDLHDGLTQELAYIVTQTKRLASLTAELAPDRRQVDYLAAAAERALDESRRAVAALTQPIYQPLHLALAQEAGEVAGRVGIELELKLDPTIEVDPATRETLLRIVREAVSNAGRHGHAGRIAVELSNGQGLRLRVVDDGEGFDPGIRSDGFGLVSMQERAKALGGRFRLASRPGSGTEIEIVIP
jgi:signal transduction histidine kinase